MPTAERHILVIVLATLFTFALVYFGFKPILDEYHTQRVATAARSAEVEALTERKVTLEAYERAIAEHSARVERLGLAAPSDAQFAELLVQLDTMASAAGLTLTNVQPSRTDPGSLEQTVTTTVRGSFPQVVTWAELIEKNLRPARIKSINVVRSGNAGAGGELAITVKVGFLKLADLSETGS